MEVSGFKELEKFIGFSQACGFSVLLGDQRLLRIVYLANHFCRVPVPLASVFASLQHFYPYTHLILTHHHSPLLCPSVTSSIWCCHQLRSNKPSGPRAHQGHGWRLRHAGWHVQCGWCWYSATPDEDILPEAFISNHVCGSICNNHADQHLWKQHWWQHAGKVPTTFCKS